MDEPAAVFRPSVRLRLALRLAVLTTRGRVACVARNDVELCAKLRESATEARYGHAERRGDLGLRERHVVDVDDRVGDRRGEPGDVVRLRLRHATRCGLAREACGR